MLRDSPSTIIHIPILNFEYDVCRYLECPHLHQLNRLTVDAYQKIAKIADHQASLQIVVGKSVAAGMILINSS